MFQEKMDTKPEKRLGITFTRQNDELLSPWEISHFINQFSSNYYKNELLISISKALNAETPAENIFILDESFNINVSYSKLDIIDLNTSRGIKQLYHLGKPISLFPNSQIHSINVIFYFFRTLNETIYKLTHKRIAKKNLKYFINQQDKAIELLEILAKMKELAYSILGQLNIKGKIPEIEKAYETVVLKVRNYKDDQFELAILQHSFSEKDYSILKKDKYNKLENKYFNTFFQEFNSNSRPVVGIYYPDLNKIQILCINHINKTKRDTRFFDLKQFSHNSPYVVDILVGISVALPLMKEIKFHIDEYKLKRRKEKISSEELILESQLEQMYEKLRDISADEGLKSINNVHNEYLKTKLNNTKDKNDQKLNEPIKKYNFFLSKILFKE